MNTYTVFLKDGKTKTVKAETKAIAIKDNNAISAILVGKNYKVGRPNERGVVKPYQFKFNPDEVELARAKCETEETNLTLKIEKWIKEYIKPVKK